MTRLAARSRSAREDMGEGHPEALNHRNQRLELLVGIQEELCYLLNSGLAWREIPSTTSTEELRPLPLLESCSEENVSKPGLGEQNTPRMPRGPTTAATSSQVVTEGEGSCPQEPGV